MSISVLPFFSSRWRIRVMSICGFAIYRGKTLPCQPPSRPRPHGRPNLITFVQIVGRRPCYHIAVCDREPPHAGDPVSTARGGGGVERRKAEGGRMKLMRSAFPFLFILPTSAFRKPTRYRGRYRPV